METALAVGITNAIQSLTTTGMIIVAITIIIFALSKFGIISKLLDREIKKRQLSTAFNKDVLNEIKNSIQTLINNDETTNERLSAVEGVIKERTVVLEKLDTRITNIEVAQYEYRMESYKKTIFDNRMPLLERMAAGIKFLNNKGNSETKKYLLGELAHKDLEMWNGLCKTLKSIQYSREERRK